MKLLKPNKLALGLILSFSIVLLATQENFAQSGIFSKKNKLNQYSTVGIGGGSSHYFGDLSPYSTFYQGLITNVRWNGTINYTRQLSSQLGVRAAFTWTRIVGDDYTYTKGNLDNLNSQLRFLRNLHFRNDIKEFTITGLFNLLPQYSRGAQGRSTIMPYTFIGIGFYAHNPQARDVATGTVTLGGWTNLKDKQTSGQGIDPIYPKAYSLLQPVFPVGMGVKIKLNEKFDLGFEGGLRITPFDYLDDVGKGEYPDPVALASYNPLSGTLSNRVGEDYSALTGVSRIENFANIALAQPFNLAGAPTPSLNGRQIYGYGVDIDGSSISRGTPRWDSYFTTQITLSFVISSQIKCPPIK
ncbi:MAG: hypothetical protein ACK4YV_08930 [Emticicia sp.]